MNPRPLSPHLQIYKLPLPAVLSITHRLTGLFLVMILWLLILGLVCLTYFPGCYGKYYHYISSGFGQLILGSGLVCFYFHLLNGIRHLFWDAGYGFSLKATYISGISVVLMTGILTLLTFCNAIKVL